MVKEQVHKALEALHGYLYSQGSLVSFAYLPEIEPGVKCGLDDFRAAGHTVDELWRCVEDELRPVAEAKPARPALPTARLLEVVRAVLVEYVWFPDEHGPIAVALFVLHAWAVAAADATPYLFVKSPVKQAGKTRLLEILELLCREALRAASITEAAIFQTIAALRPTLLIDEVDALFASKSERSEQVRGLLNAGNRRGAYAVRGTQDGEPAKFETFCAKVLAGIATGKLPDTIKDRSIVIPLERKKRDEKVERLRIRDIESRIEELRARLEEWAAYHVEHLEQVRPNPILEISDRLDEAWEPLIAIAELAEGGWPEKARQAAVALAKNGDTAGEDDHGELLIRALKGIFGDEQEAIPTADICAALNADDELPFGDYRKGEGIHARGLSKVLKPYGIKPKTIRTGDKTPKGYTRAQLIGVWSRYATEPEDPTAEDEPAQEAADDPQQAQHRNTPAGNGSIEPKTGVAGSNSQSATDPQQPDSASQSQTGMPVALLRMLRIK
jgi:Protein of unknown function (DUF3631)